KSRNLGKKIAKGKYIGFVDSDDFININMFKNMYDEAVKNNFPEVISVGISFIKNNNDNLMNQIDEPRYSKLYDFSKDPTLIYWESPSCCNKIFKKSIIK